MTNQKASIPVEEPFRNPSEAELMKALCKLKKHPYTTIQLSDR